MSAVGDFLYAALFAAPPIAAGICIGYFIWGWKR